MADVKAEAVTNGNSEKSEGDVDKKADVIKTDENSPEAVSDLEAKIIEQIEYYFSDYNLPRDKFLQEQIKLDDGWVPFETLIKFNRLAKLSTDLDVIAAAVKKSKKGLLEVSEDSKKVRRNPSHVLPEMNEARRKELINRSLYVKGFPAEVELDTILQYFAKYMKVDQVIMRRYQDKAEKKWIFKGSVFAVFPSVEDAEKFLKLENLKYEDSDLIVKWQTDYMEEKKNERLQSKLDHQNKKRKLKEDDKDDDSKEDEEEKKDSLARGAALHISDCPPELNREELKKKIEEFGIAVAFVDFNKGDPEGWIRLQETNSAAEVVKNLKDGKLELKDYSVSVRVLEGEEEETFLKKVREDMAKRRSQIRNNKGKKFRGGGGGGKFSRKRRGSPVRDRNMGKRAARSD